MSRFLIPILITLIATGCHCVDPEPGPADAAGLCFDGAPTRESEPNNSIGEADELGDGSFTGHLTPGEVDVIATRSGLRSVRVTGCSADVQVTLLDAEGVEVGVALSGEVSEVTPITAAVFAVVRAGGETNYLVELGEAPEPGHVSVELGTYDLEWTCRDPSDPCDSVIPPFPADVAVFSASGITWSCQDGGCPSWSAPYVHDGTCLTLVDEFLIEEEVTIQPGQICSTAAGSARGRVFVRATGSPDIAQFLNGTKR